MDQDDDIYSLQCQLKCFRKNEKKMHDDAEIKVFENYGLQKEVLKLKQKLAEITYPHEVYNQIRLIERVYGPEFDYDTVIEGLNLLERRDIIKEKWKYILENNPQSVMLKPILDSLKDCKDKKKFLDDIAEIFLLTSDFKNHPIFENMTDVSDYLSNLLKKEHLKQTLDLLMMNCIRKDLNNLNEKHCNSNEIEINSEDW